MVTFEGSGGGGGTVRRIKYSESGWTFYLGQQLLWDLGLWRRRDVKHGRSYNMEELSSGCSVFSWLDGKDVGQWPALTHSLPHHPPEFQGTLVLVFPAMESAGLLSHVIPVVEHNDPCFVVTRQQLQCHLRACLKCTSQACQMIAVCVWKLPLWKKVHTQMSEPCKAAQHFPARYSWPRYSWLHFYRLCAFWKLYFDVY